MAEKNNKLITLFTIGFTKKNAKTFFETLRDAGVKKLIDIRLNNKSQLAGFTKQDDLKYFLKKILDIEYIHVLEFAPTDDILTAYKKKEIDWTEYEKRFNNLIKERKIENIFIPSELNRWCLMCSEPLPNKCHRRLVAEYLKNKLSSITLQHL